MENEMQGQSMQGQSMQGGSMDQMSQQMQPHVLTCMAMQCSYNCDEECCAPSVQIGDEHPQCDTFTTKEVQMVEGEPAIQDCRVSECHYNDQMHCRAAGITLMTHWGHADCATYRQ